MYILRKVFISVDMEGLPHIVSRAHLTSTKQLYSEARSIATELTTCVAEAFKQQGFDEIVVADSHGEMIAIDPMKIPEYVELVRGFPRPLSMTAGAENCEAAVFLGYHAKVGTERAIFDHTFSGTFLRGVKINGILASEYLLNTYVLGEMEIPVILVAGDKALIEHDVKHYTPWAVTIALKESLSRYSAKSPSITKLKKQLRNAVMKAVKLLEEHKVKPLKPKVPVELELEFTNSAYADLAELLPGAKRISGTTIIYRAKSMREAFKIMELLVFTAAGVRYIAET